MLNNVVGLLGGAAPEVGDYESIATTTVGAGGSATITFSTIPGTYKHLQIRGLAQSDRATIGIDSLRWTYNGVGGTSYSVHGLRGDGSSVVSDATTSGSYAEAGRVVGTTTAGTFGGFVLDILDYSSTSKYKTSRILGGVDVNGTVGGLGGAVGLSSAAFMDSSNPISSITLTVGGGTKFTNYSHLALYGIK